MSLHSFPLSFPPSFLSPSLPPSFLPSFPSFPYVFVLSLSYLCLSFLQPQSRLFLDLLSTRTFSHSLIPVPSHLSLPFKKPLLSLSSVPLDRSHMDFYIISPSFSSSKLLSKKATRSNIVSGTTLGACLLPGSPPNGQVDKCLCTVNRPRSLAKVSGGLALGCPHAETDNPKFRSWLLALVPHLLSLGRVPLCTLATQECSLMSLQP